MENEKITQTQIDSETPEQKKYCKRILSFLLILFLTSLIFTDIWDWIIYYLWLGNYYGIIVFLMIILPILWVFGISIYSIHLRKKSLLSKKYFKKIMIIWAIPTIALLIFWGCSWILILSLKYLV